MYGKYENSSEQCRILRQLKVMFPSTSNWRMREICEAKNWHLDSCIDELMTMADTMSCDENDVATKLKQQNVKSNITVVLPNNFNKEEERIGSLIEKGFCIMILMRGLPGVGKSFVARSLVNNFVDLQNSHYNIKDFVCSSDDYFYNSKGIYKYNSAFISHAHEFNIQRVNVKAKSGLSPIIIDNTNMQLWEMLPYVKLAIENNYLIEILEPNTPWSKSLSSLAQKNQHGVPRHRIQRMMEKYEKCCVDSLTKMLKDTKYTKTLPQMRLLPPLHTLPVTSQILKNPDRSHPQFLSDIAATDIKEQRTKFKADVSPILVQSDLPSSPRNVYSLLKEKTTSAWKLKQSKLGEQQFSCLDDSNHNSKCNKTLLDLLREDSREAKNKLQSVQHNDTDQRKSVSSFERHRVGCRNELPGFVSLRQIYPNKRVSGLWDLFVKCNGDVDWAIDILLKEDDLDRIRGNDDGIYQPENDELFGCLCNSMEGGTMKVQDKISNEVNVDYSNTTEENVSAILITADAKPQRQRPRFSRSNQLTNQALLKIKESMENRFVLGDDQYSEHLLKIRNIRSGASEVNAFSNAMAECYENQIEDESMNNEVTDGNIENENEEDDNESEGFNEDMLEMSLGEQLIQELVNTFRNESSLQEQVPTTLPSNLKVFMPRSLAKQLYMIWMESALNYIEEERHKVMKEDEDFARLLKNPKYSDYKESPSNVREILDMEYALKVYHQGIDEQKQSDFQIEKFYVPPNLASHLTHLKLCELFPEISRETLVDMLSTNGNDYDKTVAVLRSTMNIDVSTTPDRLIQYAQQEKEVVTQQIQNEMQLRQERVSNNWSDYDKSSTSPDEVKLLALREFEDSRNLAAHHCQLKAECYQKAKEAIRSGNGGAAIYYSEIANLHMRKIDMYNHRAANCIVDVHKNTQNNPDLLDLHYLYLIEALGCLDLFLDRHITGLRAQSRNYKHVFIITGRGKHSAGGVSTIKNKVKARLKERCLRWSEVNPGLLKVKIFSGSRHSKNI